MLTLAVCPHESRKGLEKWKAYANKLSQYLREEVVLINFKDFEEEEKFLDKLKAYLYYARPKIALALKKLGYLPLAKLKDEKDIFVLLKKKGTELKKPVKVAVIPSAFFLMSLLKRFESLIELNFIYCKSFEEVIEELIKGKAQLGVVFKQFWEGVKDKYEDVLEVEEEIYFPSFHILMVKKEAADRLKAILKIIPDFEKVSEEDLVLIEYLEKMLAYFVYFRSFHDISQALFNAPKIGVVVYRDKILYANEAFLKMTGYSEEELKRMSPLELFDPSEDLEFIKSVIERRLRGEQFEITYKELKLKRKDGKVIHALVFSRTILFEGEYAGFVIVIDNTQRKRLEELYNLIREVNQTIIGVESEGEVFREICRSLVEKLNFPLVWIGVVRNASIEPIEVCGRHYDYLEKIREFLKGREPSYLAIQAVKRREIVVNPDTRENPEVEPWREEMLKRGFLSSYHIPLEKDNKVVAVINLYASEPYFFTEEAEGMLEELKQDLSFSLKRLEEIKNLTVINEALELAEEWVLAFDEYGKVEFTNNAVKELLEYDPKEIIGQSLEFVANPYFTKEKLKELLDRLKKEEIVQTLLPLRKKSGKYAYLNARIVPVKLPDKKPIFVMVARDITLELKLTQELERAKFYDLLTGLYNFNGFSFKVQEILSEYDGVGALILVDIRNMSSISHYYGFYVGDEVLKEIARRLKEEFRSYDVLARVGGDDFCVFVWKIKSKEELTSLVRKLNKIFEKPVKVEGYEIPVSFYAGVAVYPDDGTDFKTLYENASTALKKVKSLGAGSVFFFNKELREVSKKQMEAHLLIEKALKKNLFVFFYQPYFSLKEMKLAGLEALVRIIDEEGTVHLPSEFIEFLEKSPYIKDFQYWALEEITKASRKWGVPIAFNLCPKTLQNDEFVKLFVKKCLREGALITLEITERDLIENIEIAKNVLTFVKSSCYGLCVAIDDFGTGYSNFAYLKELPIDYLKIDMSFIQKLAKSKKDRVLVNAIVQLAHSLGIRTIAEGVETKEQVEILKELGCDMAQGYYFAKPMPEQEIEKRLKEWIK